MTGDVYGSSSIGRRLGTYLAVRCILVGVGLFLTAAAVGRLLPMLADQTGDLQSQAPKWAQWVEPFGPWLMVLPVPGLVLAILALLLRPIRGILALAATAVTLAAMAIIVGSLLAGLLPLYQGSEQVLTDFIATPPAQAQGETTRKSPIPGLSWPISPSEPSDTPGQPAYQPPPIYQSDTWPGDDS